jgi:hypothetical protein
MKKTVLTFGIISGVVLSVMMALTMPFSEQIGHDRAAVIGYTTMLAAGLLIYFGIRSYRDNVGGGTVRFGRAFAVGMLIVAVSNVFYVATWQYVYTRHMPDYFARYQAEELKSFRAEGATEAQVEAKIAEDEKWARWYANPFIRAAVTFVEPLPVGLLVSLISAYVLSRRRGPDRIATG